MCANSAELSRTQQYRDEELSQKFLTETYTTAPSHTQPNWRQRSAKPLLVGSIPTAASLV